MLLGLVVTQGAVTNQDHEDTLAMQRVIVKMRLANLISFTKNM